MPSDMLCASFFSLQRNFRYCRRAGEFTQPSSCKEVRNRQLREVFLRCTRRPREMCIILQVSSNTHERLIKLASHVEISDRVSCNHGSCLCRCWLRGSSDCLCGIPSIHSYLSGSCSRPRVAIIHYGYVYSLLLDSFAADVIIRKYERALPRRGSRGRLQMASSVREYHSL